MIRDEDKPFPATDSDPSVRRTILITHANPEDNEIARWLAARLSMAGYKVWIDLRSLSGGNDFWDEIENQLRTHAIKQIVLISSHIRKAGVKKELALGDYIGKQLGDPDFMIPVRISAVPHGEFPPEVLRRNAFDAFPNWAAVLAPIFKTLSEAGVPRSDGVEGDQLRQIVAAQEAGRLLISETPETLLSNWFEIARPRPTLRFFAVAGATSQLEAWLQSVRMPHVLHSGLVGTFCEPADFALEGEPPPKLTARFWIPFDDLVAGREVAPFPNRGDARRALVNLLRQHWDCAMERRGLHRFEFASGQVGWFFPDGLIETGWATGLAPDGRKVSRRTSGKFKDRRWHLCLVARPRTWPTPLLRIHANVALSVDGVTPLDGQQTHKVRLRLTRSWWNDRWRDMLLAGISWIAEGRDVVDLGAGEEGLSVSRLSMTVSAPVSYAAEEERPIEEDASGDIRLSEELDEVLDDGLGPEEASA